jgi:flagellar basal-body rod modification protein FlgD
MQSISPAIPALQTPGNGPAATASPIDKGLGKDAFLKLLVAQLRNQDPLNPVQGTDFIAQTAQFSSLEQLQQINQSLAALTASSSTKGGGSLDAVLASSYIGKVVNANGTVIDQVGAGPVALRYQLPSAAASVQIQVRDLQGNPVRTLQLGAQPAGAQQRSFDGLGDDGRPLPPGRYVYSVAASDPTGNSLSGVMTASGKVTAVTFDGNQPFLSVTGSLVPLSAVSEVSMDS